jgi:hypothetical protein
VTLVGCAAKTLNFNFSVVGRKEAYTERGSMKVCLGLTDSSPPDATRLFGSFGDKLVDVQFLHARCLSDSGMERETAYELATLYFPRTISDLLTHHDRAKTTLTDLRHYLDRAGLANLRGPCGEKTIYNLTEVRLVPPLQNPEKSFVIGFSDKARIESMPQAEIPTGFYKLPQTFVTDGAPIVLPKLSEEVDADACLAIVIGKAGTKFRQNGRGIMSLGQRSLSILLRAILTLARARRRITCSARTFLRVRRSVQRSGKERLWSKEPPK